MSKKQETVDKSRRNFLFGAVRRYKNEDADQPVASVADAVDMVKAANACYVDQAWDDGCAKYKECLSTEKNDPDIRYRLGVCLYKLERYRQAKLEFERVLRIDRGYRDAFLYLGLTLVRLGRVDKAPPLWSQYFNPAAIQVQRELNIQLGLMEDGSADTPERIAEDVEKAIAQAGDTVG